MNAGSVDIVVNNYNYGRYLGAAIDSALAQRDAEVHVIVVDDGSTDGSSDVVARYGDRVTAVLKPNGGQASALNAAMAHRRSDVVMFLDADDLLLPDAAATALRAFGEHPELVKVQFRMAVIDGRGRRTGEVKPPDHVRPPSGDVAERELTSPFDLVWMATSANAFSARALDRLMPIPEDEFRDSPDWYLQHLTPLLGPVASLTAVAACYRVHGANSYEPAADRLELEHVRQSVRYAAATRRHLRRVARELDLPMRPGPILSVADLANRLISLRLEPAAHPLRDRVPRLAAGGAVAALRRSDVRWPWKVVTIAWFAAMACAPRRHAHRLAELFLFPGRRPRVNVLLGALKRPTGAHVEGSGR
jgi:hypothetical protein